MKAIGRMMSRGRDVASTSRPRAPSLDRTTYVLDARTLLHHRTGQTMALASTAIGRTFSIESGPHDIAHHPVSGRRSERGAAATKKARSQIAIVDVIGPLSQRADYFCGWIDGYDSIAERVTSAIEDTEVGAVVLRVDSPGGDLAGLEECIRSIVAVRDAEQKPIGVYVDELACSAAYWLAAGVSDAGIFAPTSAEVGSIGCYTMFADMRGALEQEGNAVTLVRDPPGKDAGNPFDPVVDVALERERVRVTEAATRFYEAIGSLRGVDALLVRALNGATFGAAAALEKKLIDGVMSISGVIETMSAKAQESELSGMRGRLSGAKARRTSAMKNTKRQAAEDVPAGEGESNSSGRATAAEVSTAAADCATVCTDAATACDGGTADEAIAATTAMIAACENAIKVGQSFLGGGTLDAPAEMAEPTEPAAAAADARVLKLLDTIESERRAEAATKRAAAVAEERAKLLAESRIVSKELRALVEDPKTPIETARRIARSFPAEVPNLAGDVTAVGSLAGGGTGVAGLTERELKICRDTGCTPEKFAELKARREAQAGRS